MGSCIPMTKKNHDPPEKFSPHKKKSDISPDEEKLGLNVHLQSRFLKN